MQNEVQIHEVEIVFLHPLTRIYNASNLIDCQSIRFLTEKEEIIAVRNLAKYLNKKLKQTFLEGVSCG